jgi:hypothetical protein
VWLIDTCEMKINKLKSGSSYLKFHSFVLDNLLHYKEDLPRIYPE